MSEQKLVKWSKLPENKLHQVFPDARFFDAMEGNDERGSVVVRFYRIHDAAGNDAFILSRGGSAVSHGAHILDDLQISDLREAGAELAGG